MFRWILFSGHRVEVENVSADQRPGRPFLSARITQIGRGRWDLASCQVSLNLVQRSRRRSRNVSANQRLGGHLFPPIDPKNTNLLEGVEILRPVKFCWIPFSGFRGEIENASANHRPGGYLVPPIDPKNTNVIEDVEILLPVNFVEFHSSVSEEKPRMSQPIRSRVAILFFQSAGKTQPW